MSYSLLLLRDPYELFLAEVSETATTPAIIVHTATEGGAAAASAGIPSSATREEREAAAAEAAARPAIMESTDAE